MNELERELKALHIAKTALEEAEQSKDWVQLYEIAKDVQRIAFRIYMMTE